MKMCLVMILVMKVFIFSKTMIICLLCPLLCGLFFFWKGAKGELSYKVKKGTKKADLTSVLICTYHGCEFSVFCVSKKSPIPPLEFWNLIKYICIISYNYHKKKKQLNEFSLNYFPYAIFCIISHRLIMT